MKAWRFAVTQHRRCPWLQATSGERWVGRRPRVALGRPQGVPAGSALLSAVTGSSRFPFLSWVGWEAPNFCPTYGGHVLDFL